MTLRAPVPCLRVEAGQAHFYFNIWLSQDFKSKAGCDMMTKDELNMIADEVSKRLKNIDSPIE